VVAFLGAAALLLAGCTEVPSHSAPEPIQSILLNTPIGSPSPPPQGASARDIVEGFLSVSAAEAGTESSAREYLTRAARSGWQDSSVTVVDSLSVGNFTPGRNKITVTGRKVGTVSEQGVYEPTSSGLLGTGSGGGDPFPFVFRIAKVRGEYRIAGLPNGLLLTAAQFADIYAQHSLEFFDLAGTHLVPDPRYTPLTDRHELADWLVNQLAAGPAQGLQGAVTSGTFPSSATGGQLSVQLAPTGGVTKIEVVGAAQLDTTGRDQLAAQLSQTLIPVVGNGLLSITDGGKAITIPTVHSAQFVATQFESSLGPPAAPAEVYYLRNGRVIDEKGRDLTGTGVDGSPYLSSVALAQSADDPNSLAVAGTVVIAGTAKLYVGTQQLGLYPTDVHGTATELSRPAWAPGRPEVWIGAGHTLYRLTVDGGVVTALHRIDLRQAGQSPSNAADQPPIDAVRISPDGSRIALVLGDPGQIYVGVIVRTAGQVRVQTLTPISPQGVAITDVAWNGPTKLLATGVLASSGDARLGETNVDGAGWSLSGMPGLPPGGPGALTVTSKALAWVSVGNTVWKQGSTWTSPDPSGQTTGYDPVYLE
jgi:hypothetical protein